MENQSCFIKIFGDKRVIRDWDLEKYHLVALPCMGNEAEYFVNFDSATDTYEVSKLHTAWMVVGTAENLHTYAARVLGASKIEMGIMPESDVE